MNIFAYKQVLIRKITNVQQLQIGNSRILSTVRLEHFDWQNVKMELINALSTSSETPLLNMESTYSIDTASQGNVIGPSLGNPNSSADIFKSFVKTTFLRYAKGIINRFPSIVYTLK